MKVKTTTAGFTLTELLVVMVIIGILIAIAVPTLSNLSARSIRMATPTLTSTIRLARQYAVTQRKNVWIVFPGAQTDAEPEDTEKLLRSFAVITTNKKLNVYEYVSDWKYLPKGVSFLTNAIIDITDKGHNVMSSYSDPGDSATEFPFPADYSGTTRNMAAIMFIPNGKAQLYISGKWTTTPLYRKTAFALTTARYFEADPLNIVQKNVAGVTNVIFVQNLTGQIR